MKRNGSNRVLMALAGILTMLLLFVSAAQAQDRGRRQHGPPPEAYAACEGKSEGDTASFESPHGDTVTGTCVQERNGDQLVLRPDNMPEHGGSGN